jgi:hypothetical protein
LTFEKKNTTEEFKVKRYQLLADYWHKKILFDKKSVVIIEVEEFTDKMRKETFKPSPDSLYCRCGFK